MSKKKTRITLEEIMLNEPREIEVEGYGTVSIRDPTKKDRIDARKEAKTNPLWDEMSEEEKNLETLDRLIRRIIVDPEISEEVYISGKESTIRDIMDSVIVDYTKRLRALSDKRKKTLKDFLGLLQEGSPESS